MTPLYEILIRRDAHTITPVTVPDYEVPLIQELFGTENVQNADKVRAMKPVSVRRSVLSRPVTTSTNVFV